MIEETVSNICSCCVQELTKDELPPRELVIVANGTKNEKVEIVACPECDGDLLELANRG